MDNAKIFSCQPLYYVEASHAGRSTTRAFEKLYKDQPLKKLDGGEVDMSTLLIDIDFHDYGFFIDRAKPMMKALSSTRLERLGINIKTVGELCRHIQECKREGKYLGKFQGLSNLPNVGHKTMALVHLIAEHVLHHMENKDYSLGCQASDFYTDLHKFEDAHSEKKWVKHFTESSTKRDADFIRSSIN